MLFSPFIYYPPFIVNLVYKVRREGSQIKLRLRVFASQLGRTEGGLPPLLPDLSVMLFFASGLYTRLVEAGGKGI
jgi:hypothetical protein